MKNKNIIPIILGVISAILVMIIVSILLFKGNFKRSGSIGSVSSKETSSSVSLSTSKDSSKGPEKETTEPEEKEWERTNEQFSYDVTKGGSSLSVEAEGATATLDPDGTLTATLSGLKLSDVYEINTLDEGDVELLWQVTVETSLGSFVLYTKNVSSGPSNKSTATVSELEAGVTATVLGEEMYIGRPSVSVEGDSITWKIMTMENLPLTFLKIKGCTVEIYDYQNRIDSKRTYK